MLGFVDAGVPVTVILMTLGEMGIQKHMAGVNPDKMKGIRRKEFFQAMKYFHSTGIALDQGDFALHKHDDEVLLESVLKPVREGNYGVLFSFREEPTPYVDHPDHDKTGHIARIVGAGADVSHYHMEIPAMKERPNLFLLTHQIERATHMLPISRATKLHRLSYLEGFYPSQFTVESIAPSGVIFDRLSTHEGIQGNAELYMQIR